MTTPQISESARKLYRELLSNWTTYRDGDEAMRVLQSAFDEATKEKHLFLCEENFILKSESDKLQNQRDVYKAEWDNIAYFLSHNFPELASVDAYPAERAKFVIRKQLAELSSLRSEVERLKKENDALRFNVESNATGWQESSLTNERLESENASLKSALKEAVEAGENLASYAITVRVDRQQGEYALQTVEWAQGLMDHARQTDKLLSTLKPILEEKS